MMKKLTTVISCFRPAEKLLALLQELLLALRANDAEGFKGWLALGLEELGRQIVLELMQDWMSPLLTEKEQDRLVGWHLGVSL
jgi:hypothetical protein